MKLFRKANRGGRKLAYKLFSKYACCCDIPWTLKIGNGLRLPHAFGIVISDYSEIGENVTIFHNVTIGVNEHKKEFRLAPKIKDGAYIGAGAVIMGNITVGEESIIGANATVTRDVKPNTVVVGENRIIRYSAERNPHPAV